MITLLKSISNSDTILSISSDIILPPSNGVLLIDTEKIIYDDNYMGTLYGCLRGAQGTSTDSHLVGSTLTLVDFYGAGAEAFAGITDTTLTASRALASDSNKKLVSSATTSTELSYINGVTSAIQTQLNSKEPTLAKGNLTATSSKISISGTSIGSVIGSGVSIDLGTVSHADLSSFQGGLSGERYHLSAAEYTISTQAATGSLSGYLTSTDWNTFNSKLSSITFPLVAPDASISTPSYTGVDPATGMFFNYSTTPSIINFTTNGVLALQIWNTGDLFEGTSLFVFDYATGAISQVLVGANDSAGIGYRTLMLVNS